VWQRLATDLKPCCLAGVTRTIGFDQLPGAFDDYIQGRVKGRTVVRIGA
jgi:alcohol dehydrogenase